MAQNFLECDREQELLLPPSLREWLREGPRYEPPDTPAGTINLTDLDSRNLKTPRGWVQGYNAQAATNEPQIVIAAEVTMQERDGLRSRAG